MSNSQSGDVYVNEPWLSVRWDNEHRCVYSEWIGFCSSAEFRTGTMKILAAIEARQATSLVSDTRRLEGIATEDQLWVRDTLMPHAVAAGLKRVAVVMAHSGLAKFAMAEIRQAVGDGEFVTGTFVLPADALKWVASGEKPIRGERP